MKSNTNVQYRWLTRALIFTFLFFVLLISCDNKRDSQSEARVISDFKSFYTSSFSKDASLRINDLEQKNPDALRMIAYIWNEAALKECGEETSLQENEIPLSDFDAFVKKEKSNFHLNKIDESIKPCITKFYREKENEITDMVRFNLEAVN